ncbi:hypothetical protein BDK51DRAFT_52272 [Blyttiomyces helicus]|uniref:Uncharacterized protein n=1 Tax=Blyttiomyces helicus TaxID=388810 RepID=A0A4P9W2G0_9FUNG|nr:hypothetical protein BDK51DRAFT_52272 [Blyttiomyces helicus]|eukprot:RKO85555.1 hypothetical protein BDK51DRAFT_52272 [Blyttiomyces helicus]
MIFTPVAVSATAQVCETNKTVLLDQSGVVVDQFPASSSPMQHKITFSSTQERIDDMKGWFYNFGAHSSSGSADGSTVGLAPIWVPSYHVGYSDLWKVKLVSVPASYPLNAFKSSTNVLATAANSSGVTINSTAATLTVNCPVIPFGSTAVDTSGSSGIDPKYVNSCHHHRPRLPNQSRERYLRRPAVFEGFSTPFWNLNIVTVPASVAGTDTLRSQSEILATKYPINTTALVVNCPFRATGMDSRAGGVKASAVMILAMAGAVGLLFVRFTCCCFLVWCALVL